MQNYRLDEIPENSTNEDFICYSFGREIETSAMTSEEGGGSSLVVLSGNNPTVIAEIHKEGHQRDERTRKTKRTVWK